MKRVLAFLFFLPFPLRSQFLSAKIAAADWGLKDFLRIQYGQIAVLHEPGGDRLTVYTLRDTLPSSPPISTASSVPIFEGNWFLVSEFGGGMRNALGGSFNAFQRPPSSAFAEYETSLDGRRALRLSYSKERDGFCGLWIHLFNTTAPSEERTYFDASAFSAISFWIRGSSSNEKLSLKIADVDWERKEDAMEIGGLNSFLPNGRIDTSWQQVVIPFSRIPKRIDRSRLATLSLEVADSQSGSVYLKSLAFCTDSTSLPTPSPPMSQSVQSRELERAVWVWNTDELFLDQQKRKELFTLLSEEKMSHVFLAIPYRAQNSQRSRGIRIDAKAMQPLVSELKKKGVVVHALLGDKDFILPDQREFVKSTLENILRYNGSSKKSDRFDGIHFDVEPYLIAGFNGPRGKWILENFLDLLKDATSTAKRGKLLMGADIPFWLDTPDEFSRARRLIKFQGVTKPVHEHIIDLMDIVVLMSYRTFAAGADGIVLHSSDELEYATKTRKRVFVALETSPIPDENILSFRGSPSEGSSQPGAPKYVALVPRLDSAKIFIVQPAEKTAFDVFLTESGVNLAQVIWWPIYQDLFVPGRKVSFATLDAAKLRSTLSQTEAELSVYTAFEGFAIHHAESYLQFLRRP